MGKILWITITMIARASTFCLRRSGLAQTFKACMCSFKVRPFHFKQVYFFAGTRIGSIARNSSNRRWGLSGAPHRQTMIWVVSFLMGASFLWTESKVLPRQGSTSGSWERFLFLVAPGKLFPLALFPLACLDLPSFMDSKIVLLHVFALVCSRPEWRRMGMSTLLSGIICTAKPPVTIHCRPTAISQWDSHQVQSAGQQQ